MAYDDNRYGIYTKEQLEQMKADGAAVELSVDEAEKKSK